MPYGSPTRMRLTADQRADLAKAHDQNTDTGTTSTIFQIDSSNSGPKLKQSSGALVARNAADDADVPVKAASYKTGEFTLTVDETKAVSAKANKDTDAVVGNLTQFTTGGDIEDSGIAPADKADTVAVNPKALSQGIHMTAASSGSNGIQVANNDDINFGTGDFTLVWIGSLPDWSPSSMVYLLNRFNTGSVRMYFIANTSGKLTIVLNTSDSFHSTEATGLSGDSVHQIAAVITRNGVTGAVDFYVDGKALGTSVALTADQLVDLGTGSSLYIGGNDTLRHASTTLAAYAYNYALSADQVRDLYRNGVAFADKDGSMTELVANGDFTNWTGDDPDDWTLAFTEDANNYVNEDAGKAHIVSDGTFVAISQTVLTVGMKYRIVVDIATFNSGAITITAGAEVVTYTTSGVKTIEATATTTEIGIKRATGQSCDVVINSISVIQLGTTLRLEPENIQAAPGQWLDAANGHHAKMPAAGATLIRPKNTFEIRWTNTWAGTHEAQFLSGFNQNVLPSDNIRIDSITMTATATGGNVIIGDGSDTDRFVASVAIATYLDCTIANRNHDGTNRKMVIDPDTNFTGSITTVVRGTILD